MKNYLLIIFHIFFHSGKAQGLYERKLISAEKDAIIHYFKLAQENNWFLQDIGIVHIAQQDRGEEKLWTFSMVYDDGYKLKNPKSYAFYRNNIVLFSYENSVENPPIINERNIQLLDSLVGDRVYIKPKRVNRPHVLRLGPFSDDPALLDSNGKVRISEDSRSFNLCGDDSYFSVHFISNIAVNYSRRLSMPKSFLK